MGQMWGLDPASTRELSGRLRSSAERLDSTLSGLGRDIAALEWRGADAEAFRAAWTGEAAPRLADTVRQLRAQSESLAREAEAQERASRSAP